MKPRSLWTGHLKLAARFDPSAFVDRYQAAVRELIEAKLKGTPLVQVLPSVSAPVAISPKPSNAAWPGRPPRRSRDRACGGLMAAVMASARAGSTGLRRRARYTVAARCSECAGYHDNPQRRFDRLDDALAYARKWNAVKPALLCGVFRRHFRRGGVQVEFVGR